MVDLLLALPLALLAAAAVIFLPAQATTLALPPAPDPVPASPKTKRPRLRFIDYYSRLQLLEMANEFEVGTSSWRRKASKIRLYNALMRVGVARD